jgi:dolichyl-phosphate-mannose--protein O-mannosyl transferase
MTALTLLSGAAIVALVALSFQIWGWSTETNKPAIRLVYRLVAAVCGTMIVAIIYFVPYALVVAALAGAAIGIVLTIRGRWRR